MLMAYHVMSSPVGLLFLARSERGLRYLEFMDRKSLKRMIANHVGDEPDATWRPSLLELKPVVEQLEAYFYGARTEFSVPLDPHGSDFQLKVWRALCQIPYGHTRTYREVAAAVGQPRAARAIGLANNQNPIAIVVPCHRVIGSDGSMVGYGGGIQRKQWLLDNEARYARLAGRTGNLFAPPAQAPGTAVVSARPAARTPGPRAVPAKTPGTGSPAARRPGAKAPPIKLARAARAPAGGRGGAKRGNTKTGASARPGNRSGPTARKAASARAAARGPSR